LSWKPLQIACYLKGFQQIILVLNITFNFKN
jgi:hypothetical protein